MRTPPSGAPLDAERPSALAPHAALRPSFCGATFSCARAKFCDPGVRAYHAKQQRDRVGLVDDWHRAEEARASATQREARTCKTVPGASRPSEAPLVTGRAGAPLKSPARARRAGAPARI